MKICQNCNQLIAEEINTCPSCGSEVMEGRKYIDDYLITQVIHEGYSSTLCKGRKEDQEETVMIRIFTAQSGVDDKIAARLKQELEELKKLPEDYFVKHLDIRKSSDGFWYRVSEWVDAENWGSLLASGQLQNYEVAFKLFSRIASILEGLHQIGHFMPYLILDDIMVIKSDQDNFEVKIDYKLSRFLSSHKDHSGPMLKKLLDCHPDVINQRPLDFRSDIWSLGKIYMELLTVDFESRDFLKKIDKLSLPQEIALLFKTMLAEDPNIRPRSMAEVAEVLSQIKDEEIKAAKKINRESAPAPVKQVRGLKKRLTWLIVILAALGILFGGMGWYYFSMEKKDSEVILTGYANKYAASTAFLMVDYQLFDGDTLVFQNRSEGSAFLVDKEGFLLTNRHVACPWLEDPNLHLMINLLRQNQRKPRFSYRMFLWFEGEKAFNRLPDMSGNIELEDFYSIDSAFSTDGMRRLSISGVAKSPDKTWQLVKSPLKDDFAVLKIENIPEGLEPLPLDLDMDPLKISRLSSIITLGFPLGSKTQAKTVNVSATQGHVRRTFENMLQVDTSIHSGNSGGPAIDIHGKVIGITSSVFIGRTVGPVPSATPLSDIGLILPITKAVNFIQELKAGQIKWKGGLDLSIDTKLNRIADQAKQGKWSKARTLADKELEISPAPVLVMAAGIMNFCFGDQRAARKLFTQALSMDDENTLAKLMLFISDWLSDQSHTNAYRKKLLTLDWRSSNEFMGHLAKVLVGLVDEETALNGGYSNREKSWLHYVVGLIHFKKRDWANSEKLFKKAVLLADTNDWLFFLAYARLEQVQNQRLKTLTKSIEKARYKTAIASFAEIAEKEYDAKSEKYIRFLPLFAKFKLESTSLENKQNILKQLHENDPENRKILRNLAFYYAMGGKWEEALKYIRTFRETKGRESLGWLSAGLLEAGILYNMEQKQNANTKLEAFHSETKDPWYRSISKHLLGKQNEQPLSKKAEENLEYLVTWHTALGFWAEGARDKKQAIKHYKEALGSYMDTRIEYEFSKIRFQLLKRPSDQ